MMSLRLSGRPFPRRGLGAAALLCGSAACATAPIATPRVPDAEYQVYAALLAILGEHRPAMVVVDRTLPLPCPTGLCRGDTALELWPEAWADYVRNNRASTRLHPERFPPGLAPRLSSRERRPPVKCEARAWIQLSRVGFSADSSQAMLNWVEEMEVGPTRGCRDPYGSLMVLQRRPGGGWEVISPRYLHPGGISPLPRTGPDSGAGLRSRRTTGAPSHPGARPRGRGSRIAEPVVIAK